MTELIELLATMITEVIGEDHFAIEASTSFRDDLAFQSIQFVALAELIQERWSGSILPPWLTATGMPELLALRVGDVADFIAASR